MWNGEIVLVFGVAHVVELGFFIGGEIAGVEGGADFFHHGVVEVEVVAKSRSRETATIYSIAIAGTIRSQCSGCQ